MNNTRFLLIKAGGNSIWDNIHQVAAMLLIAEITNRIPIVYWGTNCLYNGVIHNNAFDLYFNPISNYTIYDVINPDYTFYPPIWNHDNLMSADKNINNNKYRNLGDLIGSKDDVVVSDKTISIHELIPFIDKKHPAYGITPLQLYRYMLKKYISIKPDILSEAQNYYSSNLACDGTTLAVHMPGDFPLGIYPQIGEFAKLNTQYHSKIHVGRSDTILVDDTLDQHQTIRLLDPARAQDPYKLFHPEIKNNLGKFNIKKIFLITDREDILEEFKNKYGNMLIYKEYERIPLFSEGKDLQFDNFFTNRNRGVDIIVDSLVAAKCDFFIGYGSSSISHAITHLKDWSETNFKLIYWMFDKLYNFSYNFVKTGRKSAEEADGRSRIFAKRAKNTIKKIVRVFK